MKALVFNGVGNIAVEQVKEPSIEDSKDVIVRLTRSAICGTDLHMIRGTMTGMKGKGLFHRGTILGHEGVGVIEEVGNGVKYFKKGDRVIVPSTVSCGKCYFCNKELTSQCETVNPNGPESGTVFYGGPKSSGPLDGMQAEKVRVPYADTSLIKIPSDISDDEAILLSDILPTAYMAVINAQVTSDDSVAVFGCGPVGQLVIACLVKLDVKRIFVIDRVASRLEMARKQGAITINFDEIDPVKQLKKLTHERGPSKIIDAVGIDAEQPSCSWFSCLKNLKQRWEFRQEVKKVAPRTKAQCGNWIPGNGPSQVLRWAVEAIEKGGIISLIGVYTEQLPFPQIGAAFEKNITITMGNCNHIVYIPLLLDWVLQGEIELTRFITHKVHFNDILHAYRHFDRRDGNWIKVVLHF